jgi:hypothetical protein
MIKRTRAFDDTRHKTLPTEIQTRNLSEVLSPPVIALNTGRCVGAACPQGHQFVVKWLQKEGKSHWNIIFPPNDYCSSCYFLLLAGNLA